MAILERCRIPSLVGKIQIFGASLSEPHINGTAVREFYIIIIIMVRRSRKIIYPVMLYGHKRETFYCAFSCLGHRDGPYIRHSNLANCKFTLMLVRIDQASYTVPRHTEVLAEGSKGGENKIELVVSSTAQEPAKNTIKID